MSRITVAVLAILAVLFLSGTSVLRAQSNTKTVTITFPPRERVRNAAFEGKPERIFEELEHRLSDAHRLGERAELEKLLGEKLLILGMPQTKSQWIDLLVSGKGTFVSIEKTVTRVHILGETTIVTGMQYVDSKTVNGGSSYQFGFMNTWIRSKSGQWECVALATDQVKARD